MKVPRFRIAWVMVAVAIAALDFGAIRALLARHGSALDDQRSICLLLGALPMANVLAVGMLIGQRRPGSRPFLLGFEAFGAMALALFIALAICFPREVVLPYLTPVLVLMERTIGNDPAFRYASRSYASSLWSCSAGRKWPSPWLAAFSPVGSRSPSLHADRLHQGLIPVFCSDATSTAAANPRRFW